MQLTSVLMNMHNRTFLVRLGGRSAEFGEAMVRILVRRSQAIIPMARKKKEPEIALREDTLLRFTIIVRSTYPFTKLLFRLHIIEVSLIKSSPLQ